MIVETFDTLVSSKERREQLRLLVDGAIKTGSFTELRKFIGEQTKLAYEAGRLAFNSTDRTIIEVQFEDEYEVRYTTTSLANAHIQVDTHADMRARLYAKDKGYD